MVTNDDLSAPSTPATSGSPSAPASGSARSGAPPRASPSRPGRLALERAGLTPADVDALVLATTTGDALVPGTAATVQDALGTAGGAFDVNAACSGFVYGLVVGGRADRHRGRAGSC